MQNFNNLGYGITKRECGWGCGRIIVAAAIIIAICILGIGYVWKAAGAQEIGIRTRKVTVTAYTSRVEETDSTPCISADGSDICALEALGDHSCAAALPFGTRIWIPGFGLCTVRDRLARKYQYRIDVYYGGANRLKEARKWGKRMLLVTIIN